MPMDHTSPPMLVLQHFKENLRKCSLTHLRGHPRIEFRTVRPGGRAPEWQVRGGIVLRVEAPALRAADRRVFDRVPGAQLILVDGNWSKVPALLKSLQITGGDSGELPAEARLLFRSLPAGIATAYPRRSKRGGDPENGLASVEALVAALHLLGYPALDLLLGYHWAGEFLEKNARFFSPESAI
ncbi:MAG: hypothetical protein HY717_04865 [Planctomycetes bacterium]|nr:hypothetical protein [Planctomycetota bacterium]